MTFHLTKEAQSDLHSISDYSLKHWGMHQTHKYLTGLWETFNALANNPLLGRKRLELRPPKYSFPYQSHVIYYCVHAEKLIIAAILHRSMVPELHLK